MVRTEPKVACVVLNWNGWRDTLECLGALKRVAYASCTIIVVDNGSTDDSVERIREAAPDVALLHSGSNLGFAGGNNVGIRHALDQKADYVWLLNNDTQPRSGALTELVAKAVSDPRLGEVGSVLLYAHDVTQVQAWGGGRVSLWSGRSEHARSERPDEWFQYLTAASVLLPRAALEDVGLLDEGFFLYWEDGDLSFRLRSKGWRLGVAARSIVLHKEHASTGRNRRLIDRYVVSSGIRFLHKHSPAPAISIGLFLLLRIFKRLLTGQFNRLTDITGGIKDYLSTPIRNRYI
jgi:GT2 family glycosyltransferase